ncbi:unnamed protein product [Auanema sp. JU1783]|nr:unnamed protein product [Auanema sp. JU1783]
MCATDMPSTSRSEPDSFGGEDPDETEKMKDLPRRTQISINSRKEVLDLQNTKRRIRKWKARIHGLRTDLNDTSGPFKLSDEELQQCIDDEERDWNERAEELVENLTDFLPQEQIHALVPEVTKEDIEARRKTGKVKFRKIQYSEGELDGSDLNKPASPENPHPFNPNIAIPPVYSRTVAPYVNYVPLLQNLVDLGVNLFEIDTTTSLSRHLIRLDKEKDVKPKLQWLVTLGFEPSHLGEYITRNPFFLIQSLDDMKTRVNYLEAKKFSKDQIVKIIKEFRYWINVDVKTMDARLGWIQKQFGLSGNEVRALIVKEPRVIMFGLGPLQRLVNMLNKELLFSAKEMKRMLLLDPRLFMMDAKFVLSNYYYIYRVMLLSNEIISENPFILRCSLSSIKNRHEFLRKMNRNTYEGQRLSEDTISESSKLENDVKPVPLEIFLHPNDAVFATKAANTYLAIYNKTMKNLVKQGDNPDITKERLGASFDVDRMASFIHGGDEILIRRREILQFVKSIKEFDDPIPVEFMSREERCENGTRKIVAMTDNTDAIDGSDFFGEGMYLQSLVMGRDLHAMSLHYVMFIPTLQGQTDDDQLDKWLTLAIVRGVVGTYAQTELGHGTNLARLETTATYDPRTQEFVLHTPTITATKWWPGALGKSSNHAIVVAQLYTNGKNMGPHPFIVQIRDEETHMPLKGIKLGDIGPKLGINGSDNGFMIFDHLRIPREAMLMRYSKVLPDGTYVAPKHSKLAFGTMVFVRSIMIKDQSHQLAAAACIAIRYSAIRRQGEKVAGEGEVQIIDYQTQQYRIFPQLARAYAFIFAAYEIRDLYMQLTEQLIEGNVDLLPEIHALTSGLKSVVSWETAQGIEQCRLACGGHGYSQASAFPEIYSYAVGGCTYEGENLVMLQQVAKFLVKAAGEVRSGKARLAEICSYLGQKGKIKSSFKHWNSYSYEEVVADFEHVARQQVFRAYDLYREHQKTKSVEEAWNSASIELCKASRWHVRLYLVKNFLNKVRKASDKTLSVPLTCLSKLYAFDLIAHSEGEFLKNGYMNENQINNIREGIYNCLAGIRPDAVALVDSWDIDDRELKSVLGRRDGNVYPALLEWVQQSPLNKTEVLSSYHKYLGPMMKDAKSKI